MRSRIARLRAGLTFSNVIALIALFVALGGSAWALATNSVRSKHIVNQQVKRADIKKKAVNSSRLANGAVGTAKLGDGAVDTAKLADGAVSSAKLASEAWHEIGAAGEPEFVEADICAWENFGGPSQTAAFFRDHQGIVHLKGLVRVTDQGGECTFAAGSRRNMFTLPPGHRPPAQAHFAVITNSELGRVLIQTDGLAFAAEPTTAENAKGWLSLEGLSFPCAPSGVAGCP